MQGRPVAVQWGPVAHISGAIFMHGQAGQLIFSGSVSPELMTRIRGDYVAQSIPPFFAPPPFCPPYCGSSRGTWGEGEIVFGGGGHVVVDTELWIAISEDFSKVVCLFLKLWFPRVAVPRIVVWRVKMKWLLGRSLQFKNNKHYL